MSGPLCVFPPLFYMHHSFPPACMTRECFAFVERNPAELLKEIHYPQHNHYDYDAEYALDLLCRNAACHHKPERIMPF